MPGSLGFNSRRLTSTNRVITLGSMLASNHNGPASVKRMYYWYTKTNPNNTQNNNFFTNTFEIQYGMWGPPTTPLNYYHPYYSTKMYSS
jgi:hypothetical protein